MALSEADLIERARDGDEQAFAELVQAHADHVYGALRRFGLDAAEAEEVAQEVFLRAWRGLDRFEGRAKLSTWLYRIAFNEAQRALSRRRPVAAVRQAQDADPLDAIPGAAANEPDARALHHEFSRQLQRSLEQLPSDWRAAVVLRDIEGLSTEAAAEVIGIRKAAFKSRLHRGRMQLRLLLEPYLGLDA